MWSIAAIAQTDNTVNVKNFAGSTVGEMTSAAQASCSPSLTCIVIFDPSLANVSQGTMPPPCAACVWEDFRVPGTLSFTGNLYVNGTLLSSSSGGGSGSGGNGTLTPPTFTPAGGNYTSAQSVTIGLPAGAAGCYTVDGSTPAAATPGTCSNGFTYSSPVMVNSNETVSAVATESGWSNSLVASAVYTIGSTSAYSDNFNGENGSLGPNWVIPTANQTGSGLQIFNDRVYAQTSPVTHAMEIYTGGTFGNNQFSSFVVENIPTGANPAVQAALVRGTPASNYYNDAVPNSTVGGTYRIGNAPGSDFCAVPPSAPYSAGDTHELDVAGSGPVFFWSKRNGVVDATCIDNVYNITGGSPGVGMAADNNPTPTAALGSWQGGTLPNFSTTPLDSFQRANAGWLGVNWWFPEGGGTINSMFVLSNNSATPTVSNGVGAAFWTTPFNANHSSTITIGNLAPHDWLAAAVRYTPTTLNNDQFYIALADNNVIDLFAYNKGTWELLADLGTYPGQVSTIELDASGISPVLLTVKINGSQYGSSFSDNTYNFSGTYAGFANYGSTASNIIGWQGSNL